MLRDIDWRITNRPDMKTYYVTFITDDDTLRAINDWLAVNQIDLLIKSLSLSEPMTLGNTSWIAPAMGNLRFADEEGASLFRLTWC